MSASSNLYSRSMQDMCGAGQTLGQVGPDLKKGADGKDSRSLRDTRHHGT